VEVKGAKEEDYAVQKLLGVSHQEKAKRLVLQRNIQICGLFQEEKSERQRSLNLKNSLSQKIPARVFFVCDII
jgi:hypothetical protein